MASHEDPAAAFLRALRASADASSPADSPQLRTLLTAVVAECSSREQARGVVEELLSVRDVEAWDATADGKTAWKETLEKLRSMADAEVETRFGGAEELMSDSHVASITGATYGADNTSSSTTHPSVPVLEHPTATRSFRGSLGSRRSMQRRGSSNASASGHESGRDSFASDPGDAAGKKRRLQRTNTDDKGIPLLQRSSSVTDAVPSLLRSISSIVGVGLEDMFLCQICFEHAPVSSSIELSSCGHRFCLSCFKMYLELKIADGQVYPVCFHETEETTTRESSHAEQVRRKTCGVAVHPSDIELIISPEVLKKYETFKFNKENEYGRQCPFCHTSQVCEGPEHPECLCVACGKTFCFMHGNAHVDETCADFELKQAESDKINRSAIAEISKPCPGCKSNVEKNGGCNHMKCIVCQTDFCWICGAVVESSATPTHFQWWNLSGCAGQQMDDVDAQTPAQRFLMSIFRFCFLVILGPPALVLTLVFTLLSCCCLPCMKAFDTSFINCFTTCLNFMAMALFLLILGLAMGLAFVTGLIIQFILWPFKFIYSKCKKCCRRNESKSQNGQSDAHADLESGDHTAVTTSRNSS